ncbi:early nodulin-like protein 1 [Phoenix dactylifera]|uniref:Early nodulin-like protein 1 n=1 Tax=Phoenix dactylifera TaxID=42345 RepID=A0A8B9AVH3_PHODC|nr:early nodulin-like protein 1 [Phoenix dactylifera]
MASFHCLVLLCFVLLASMAAATQFKVGGSKGWAVPEPNAMSFNQWAEKNRFQIGDSLLFVYLPDQDSVLVVDANAYNSCDTSSFIDRFDDGNTVFTFARSGSFYFISGSKENCQKNEKLVVVVMASRSNGTSLAPSPSPVSSSSPPAPPPSGVVGIVPSSAPAGQESTTPPRPNRASVKAVGFVGTLGALLVTLYHVL